jgi:hypothetical protein
LIVTVVVAFVFATVRPPVAWVNLNTTVLSPSKLFNEATVKETSVAPFARLRVKPPEGIDGVTMYSVGRAVLNGSIVISAVASDSKGSDNGIVINNGAGALRSIE